MSSYLLVDNSNTRTKFVLASPGVVHDVRIMPTAEIEVSAVRALTADWQFCRVCMASVVPQTAELIEAAFARGTVVRLKHAGFLKVDFSQYAGIATLGEDRMANVLGLAENSPMPAVAVDMGTATTFDVAVAGGAAPVFRGGIISPGLAAFASCLHQQTAQLPELKSWEGGSAIGCSTVESMASAVRIGYPAMIDAMLDAIEQELNTPMQIVLTGGDAPALAPLLRHSCKIDPLLTIRGLASALDFSL